MTAALSDIAPVHILQITAQTVTPPARPTAWFQLARVRGPAVAALSCTHCTVCTQSVHCTVRKSSLMLGWLQCLQNNLQIPFSK